MREVFLLDIPVYRLREGDYYSDREAYVDQVTGTTAPTMEEMTRRGRDEAFARYLYRRDRSAHSYGGLWRYNEIIGYIRLHFLGTQVRGEYYGV